MAKEDQIEVSGVVVQALPNATFKVVLDDNEMEILCHISGRMRKNKIRVEVGDRVDIEMSAYDLSKGRICYRYTN